MLYDIAAENVENKRFGVPSSENVKFTDICSFCLNTVYFVFKKVVNIT